MSATPPAWTPAPAPPLRPDEERTWAILAHVLPLVGPGVLAPLVIWLVFRGRGPYLEHHAKESLNFQITAMIAGLVAGIVFLLTVGIVGLPLLAVLVAWLVLCIVAAVAASRWQWYRYPATLRLVA